MSRKRDVLMVMVALVAGIIGGAVSSWVFMSRVMVVQTPTLPVEVIRAERFEVVSKDGKIRAVLGEPTQEFFKGLSEQFGLTKEEEKRFEGKSSPLGLFLLDEARKLRASLAMAATPTGEPTLGLFNAEEYSLQLSAYLLDLGGQKAGGNIRLFTGTNLSGPSLTLDGPEGRSARLDAALPDGPVVELYGALINEKKGSASLNEKKGSASLGVGRAGPSLDLRGREGGIAALDAQLSGLGEGADEPTLSLHGSPIGGENSLEKASVFLNAGTTGPHLALDYLKGNAAWLNVGTDGPSLNLFDKPLRARAALGSIQLKDSRTGSVETRSPSSLVLFGENGKVIWQAP